MTVSVSESDWDTLVTQFKAHCENEEKFRKEQLEFDKETLKAIKFLNERVLKLEQR